MQLWKENDESLLWKKPNVCKSRQRDVTYTFLTNMGGWWVLLTFWRPFRNKPLYTAQEETALPLSSGSFSAAQPVAQLKLVQMSALCFTLSDFFFSIFGVQNIFHTSSSTCVLGLFGHLCALSEIVSKSTRFMASLHSATDCRELSGSTQEFRGNLYRGSLLQDHATL